jgi:hypothetical protein
MAFLAMVILSAQVEDDGPVWREEEGSEGGLAVCVRVAGRMCGDFFSRQEGRTYRPEGI